MKSLRRLKRKLRKYGFNLFRWFSKYGVPRNRTCSFCGKNFHNFLIYGFTSELSRTHDTTLGKRYNRCPYCESLDKFRWIWEVIATKTDAAQKGNLRILHFAPEKSIQERLIKFAGPEGTYISGDIQEGRAMMTVDMTQMQFEDESFDLIVASQVLEHIPEEDKALQELRRVLKPGGEAVISVPVAYDIKETQEDLSLGSEDRLRFYGQEDHVRLYGMDYEDRIRQKSGMETTSHQVKDTYKPSEIKKHGLKKAPPILILKKN